MSDTSPKSGRRVAMVHRIVTRSVASVFPAYVAVDECASRTVAELDEVIEELNGFDTAALRHHLEAGTTFGALFAAAQLNPNATLIDVVVCGVRVETIEDPLMQQIRRLDKLVDELAKGKPLAKILRS